MTEQRTEAAQLRQAWINEKCAPDLLFYQDRLVESAKRKMRKHVIRLSCARFFPPLAAFPD